MKVLVIGSGGREHALVWKLRQSPRVTQVYCAPGNGGIAAEAECLAADIKSVDSLVAVALQARPDLTVIGPEMPLTQGVVDEFTRRGWPVFGPTKAATRLESSKSFAKEFMQRHRIPTPSYAICNSLDEVRTALPHFHPPIVVKADGLAAGKGVVIAKTKDEAASVASEMLSGKMLGEAGARVVLEECLTGDELSFLVFSDGERVAPLVAAQDHKRIGEGDTGPNTGGMGAYSTPTIIDDKMRDWLVTHIARPVVAGMKAEGSEYRGVLYCGLMMTARGPMVLEFNCRFGDPEAQVVLPRLETDLIALLEAAARGELAEASGSWTSRSSVGVVLASRGYPGTYATGYPIEGLGTIEREVLVFHAGAAADPSGYVTAGGRVLTLVALGESMAEAKDRAYRNVDRVRFQGMTFRRDLAEREIEAPALP